MTRNRVMVISEKESFLVRVLLKKLQDAGIDTIYVSPDINAINAHWNAATLVTWYRDGDENLREDVVRFLTDRMLDDEKQLILIGDLSDAQRVLDNMPGELIYKVFSRPLDSEAYIKTVTELLQKIAAGEFKKSILVVDDDPTYLGLVREWLKDTYKVAMVSSGLQAIKWLGMNRADLILLDHEMPVTSGPKVLEMLRSDDETKDIPVIFLTGKGDRESVMKVLDLKPEGYFLKNTKREELLKKLENFFALNR